MISQLDGCPCCLKDTHYITDCWMADHTCGPDFCNCDGQNPSCAVSSIYHSKIWHIVKIRLLHTQSIGSLSATEKLCVASDMMTAYRKKSQAAHLSARDKRKPARRFVVIVLGTNKPYQN